LDDKRCTKAEGQFDSAQAIMNRQSYHHITATCMLPTFATGTGASISPKGILMQQLEVGGANRKQRLAVHWRSYGSAGSNKQPCQVLPSNYHCQQHFS